MRDEDAGEIKDYLCFFVFEFCLLILTLVYRFIYAVAQLQDRVQSSQSYQDQERRRRAIEFESTKEDGSVHVFNCVAIVLNLIKLPSVVGVFVAYYYLFGRALFGSFGDGHVVLRVCVSALLIYLAGIVSIALLLSIATRSGLASFHSGSSGYYTSRFILWWFFMWLNRLCSGLLLYPIHGTYLFNVWLRMTGAQIGERCFLDPGAAGWFELDGLQIGDDSFVMTPNVHGHFVDHGKLQFAPVTVGHKARVNDGATVMPFTKISGNVTLLTQCTTIKGNTLDSGIYMGNVAAVVKHVQPLKLHLEKGLNYLESNLANQELSEDENEDDLRIVIGKSGVDLEMIQSRLTILLTCVILPLSLPLPLLQLASKLLVQLFCRDSSIGVKILSPFAATPPNMEKLTIH